MKKIFLLLILVPFLSFAEFMYSPTWGFSLDLPEGYEYADGDARDRFSFCGPEGAMFDIVVYNGNYAELSLLIEDVSKRLKNSGDVDFFQYKDKKAAIIKLTFGSYDGWGIAVELESASNRKPMLLALAYGPAGKPELNLFHVSALDSIAPSAAERRYPGMLIDYSYPRGELKPYPLAAAAASVMIRENDAEAAQVLIEREFQILQSYLNSPYWREAWIRYYRFIYRDSYDRIINAASAITQNMNGYSAKTDAEKRAFAQKALTFVQGFRYERDLKGSDFVNLVTAVMENRGDCDSRAMLWAIILANSGIRSAFMVSRQYSHAMGLADLAGEGARFMWYETNWLVAETTAKIDIGLIAQDVSETQHWLGVVFE